MLHHQKCSLIFTCWFLNVWFWSRLRILRILSFICKPVLEHISLKLYCRSTCAGDTREVSFKSLFNTLWLHGTQWTHLSPADRSKQDYDVFSLRRTQLSRVTFFIWRRFKIQLRDDLLLTVQINVKAYLLRQNTYMTEAVSYHDCIVYFLPFARWGKAFLQFGSCCVLCSTWVPSKRAHMCLVH